MDNYKFEEDVLSFSSFYSFARTFNLIYKDFGVKLLISEANVNLFEPYKQSLIISIQKENYGLYIELIGVDINIYNLTNSIKLLIESYYKNKLELLSNNSDSKVYLIEDELGKLSLGKHNVTL